MVVHHAAAQTSDHIDGHTLSTRAIDLECTPYPDRGNKKQKGCQFELKQRTVAPLGCGGHVLLQFDTAVTCAPSPGNTIGKYSNCKFAPADLVSVGRVIMH
jgi:hypothetical protein